MLTSLLEDTMTEEKEDYKHLKKAETQAKAAEDMINMTDRTHREAFNVYEGFFKSDDGRGIDYEKAKDNKLRNEAVSAAAKVYVKKAKEVLKANPSDDLEEELLMNAYAGTTENQLKQLASQYKDKFTFRLFNESFRPQFMENIEKTLRGAAHKHLGDEHIDDIIRYTGIDKYGVDSTKVRLPEALNYLDIHRREGAVGEKQVRPEHKKDKPKDEEEELAPAA